MTYKEWFKDLDIEHDIDEVFCLYRTVKERSSEWGYEITKKPNCFVVAKPQSPLTAGHRFTARTAGGFCNYLDSLYDLGVEGEYERCKAIKKD